MPTVLALETSCDESAAAVVALDGKKLVLKANRISSQMEEHSKWGGVVPEIASRRHVEDLPSLVEEALSDAGILMGDLDAVSATVTPGLAGALLVGSITGRTLAAFYRLPFLGIHHLEGHLASALLAEETPSPPYLVLLVSGGHTELIRVDDYWKLTRLGRSHDDAAGEAFDKVARLLKLSYPGGPAIQEFAKTGDENRFSLPKGRVSRPNGGYYPYDFSFSGLKTAVLRQVQALDDDPDINILRDLAASFEKVVAEVLVERTLRCANEQSLDTLVLVGGVAANTRLREMIFSRASQDSLEVFFAPKAFCTDNAAMIGAAAVIRLELGIGQSSIELGVSPRWPLEKAKLLYLQKPPF